MAAPGASPLGAWETTELNRHFCYECFKVNDRYCEVGIAPESRFRRALLKWNVACPFLDSSGLEREARAISSLSVANDLNPSFLRSPRSARRPGPPQADLALYHCCGWQSYYAKTSVAIIRLSFLMTLLCGAGDAH